MQPNEQMKEALEYFDSFVSKSCDSLPDGFNAVDLVTKYNLIKNHVALTLKED